MRLWRCKLLPRHGDPIVVNRCCTFTSVHESLAERSGADLQFEFTAVFEDEPGTCLGPTRELFSLIPAEVTDPGAALLTATAADANIFTASACFDAEGRRGQGCFANPSRVEHFCTLGRIAGAAIFHGHTLALQLAPPFLTKVLGRPLSHPSALAEVDPVMHSSLMWMATASEEELAALEMTFAAGSSTCSCCLLWYPHFQILR